MNFSIKELNELLYSLGTTASKGMMVNKELNSSLIDKLYSELSRKLEFYDLNGYEEIDEPEFDSAGFSIEDREPHFVSNEEADEDYHLSMLQDEQRYKDSFVSDSARTLKRDRFNGVSQFILDFVEANNVVTFAEINDMYKAYTKGSNSLSHIIKALMIPYKNRPTRRYLYKVKHGVYSVKIANPSNWVESNYDYKTFNEAPYNN
jgi:hypothetical protein